MFGSWAERVTASLIAHCDSLRRLWFHPHPDPQLERSPLLTQSVTATSSQPYLVLIRLYALLGHLAYHCPALVGLGRREAELVVGWITTVPTNKVSRELLNRVEFVQVAEMLLSAIPI